MAYWMADRISRSLPSTETGLKPIAELSGKRTFLYNCGNSRLRNPMTFFTSSLPFSNSIPA